MPDECLTDAERIIADELEVNTGLDPSVAGKAAMGITAALASNDLQVADA